MKKFKKMIWGLCFIVIGLLLCFKALGIMDFNIFFKGWWTLFIIIPCFIGLFDGELFGNFVGLFLGFSLLCGAQGWISYGVIAKLIFPVILVFIGISILWKEMFLKSNKEEFKKVTISDENCVTSVFSSQRVCPGKNYSGSNVEAIFGSVELDLRDTDLNKETFINVNAIFGGVTILVPNNVLVKVKSTPIFGGVDNKVKSLESASKTIFVDATSVFGGVDIK